MDLGGGNSLYSCLHLYYLGFQQEMGGAFTLVNRGEVTERTPDRSVDCV